MVDYKDYANQITPAWCPGSGNWAIRTAEPRALAQAGLDSGTSSRTMTDIKTEARRRLADAGHN